METASSPEILIGGDFWVSQSFPEFPRKGNWKGLLRMGRGLCVEVSVLPLPPALPCPIPATPSCPRASSAARLGLPAPLQGSAQPYCRRVPLQQLQEHEKSEPGMQPSLGLGCETLSLPLSFPWFPFLFNPSGHRSGPAHGQPATDCYRKRLRERFLNCPRSFLKQMETGGRGRLIIEGSTCCLSSWMFWVRRTIQVECASALKQVFILVVVVTDKQLQFCW